MTDPTPSADVEDRVLGDYRILQKIGEGSSARVFLAQKQDPDLKWTVALKVLRRKRGSAALFEAERRGLARLRHPHIARLLDSGRSPDGAEYLALEYVHGLPIDEYCRQKGLNLDGRLDLFLDLCSALSHAHRVPLAHRDLKPSNVLVTEDGTVKVLDFGVAGVASGADVDTTETNLGTSPGTNLEADADRDSDPSTDSGTELPSATSLGFTPAFASPEQLAGRPVGTSSDVYSLGVLLYLLLAGRLPHDPGGKTAAQWEELVCQTDPPSLRRALELEGESPNVAPDLRPGPDVQPLSEDLVAIAAKALARDEERRYSSVAELAEDIRRFRDGLPVQARTAGAGYGLGYRTRRWLTRHRRAGWIAATFRHSADHDRGPGDADRASDGGEAQFRRGTVALGGDPTFSGRAVDRSRNRILRFRIFGREPPVRRLHRGKGRRRGEKPA